MQNMMMTAVGAGGQKRTLADEENAAYEAIMGIGESYTGRKFVKRVQKGDVVVVRYEGPRGAPGMPEMLSPSSALVGVGLGQVRRIL